MGGGTPKPDLSDAETNRKASKENESPEYKYEPLPEGDYFRLLKLEPGTGEDPLVASLRPAQLRREAHEDRFEAISYVWGSNIKDQVITVDGKSLPITSNLRNSLRQVRSPDEPRQVWADSVCINQQNNQEKGQQVAAMGRIYQTSECTLICLGSEPGFRQHASDVAALIREVEQRIDDVLEDPGFSRTWDGFPRPSADDAIVNDRRWQSWRELVDNPWFLRGWVVQEAALGPDAKILWAGAEIRWMSLLRVSQWLAYRASPQMRSSGPFWLSPLHVQKFKLERPDEDKTYWPEDAESRVGTLLALELLDYARELKLSDPRDRIYAFMALPTKGDTMPALQPDYEAHYLDVYQNFATTYLKLTSDLDLLLYVDGYEDTSLSNSQLAS
ncbi:heterokaryon incompatibility protein-domain-containing protein, partial [Diplogelasinospora grovesii]